VIGSNNHQITVAVSELGYRVTEAGVLLNPAGRPRIPHLAAKTKKAAQVLYASISVKIDGKHRSCKVHQLAAYQKFGDAAFAGGTQVRHLNGDSTDNRLENIGIGSVSDNAFDKAPEVRRHAALAAAASRRKLTQEQVLRLVEMRRAGATLAACAQEFGLFKSTVSEVMQGKLYSDLTGIPFTPRKAVAA